MAGSVANPVGFRFTQCGGLRAFRIDITTSSNSRAWHLHHLVKTTECILHSHADRSYSTRPLWPGCIGWEQGKRSRYDASDTLDASPLYALRLTPLPTSPHGLRRQARDKWPEPAQTHPTHPNHTDATSAGPTTATPWERDVVGGRARRGTHSVISNTWTEVGPSTSPLAPHPSPLTPL